MGVIASGGCTAMCEPSQGSLACCMWESTRLLAGLQVPSQDAQVASEVSGGAVTRALI